MTSSSFFIKTLFVSNVLMVYTGLCHAGESDPNLALVSASVKSICQKLENIPIPKSHITVKCDATDFYYGIHQPVNFIKARQCAENAQDYATLTMIYANGLGVERNWNLAIHFACKAGFAPAEIEGRVMHLVQLRDQHWQGQNFDICDDITSGYMMGVCADRQEKLAQVKRQHQWAALTTGWNEADKKAFLHLQQTANAFFLAHSFNEVDLSGSDRAAAELTEAGSLRDDLLTAFKNLAQGRFPVYTAAQAVSIDKQLNKIYRQIQDNHDFSAGTINRASIKKTQLIWLKYRDAWIAFGKVKYPQVDVDSWKAWLTEKRISMLQDLSESTQ